MYIWRHRSVFTHICRQASRCSHSGQLAGVVVMRLLVPIPPGMFLIDCGLYREKHIILFVDRLAAVHTVDRWLEL